ncbi:ABC transporter-like protein [Oleiphilus messinensis]|uniref:ABC transporter-like protein n=1 Tax=Oleiphilus messinensis TaxID=141451 RepID=A0A1Y0I6D8_9GAMM|nr:ABC transporter ATP-binding protein [Oleiphilus messinensis]ARU55004.1 ABC transporter-like protein [Oleiphilus messinensis]
MIRISVNAISKRYKHYPTHWARLSEWLSLGRIEGHEARNVLNHINFVIHDGESVGIVGQNGAGKSTLLKILTGTTKPTSGTVDVHGEVAALLELGMGFHPDFSGRQNAIMGCQMRGMNGTEIEAEMDNIIAFAELSHCIDKPIKTYSSGMQMRLAFSVATCKRPDVLIVDEALSVGDAYFQHKSMARIRQFKEQGTSLLFVSHDPAAVKTLCDRAILLDDGVLIKDGRPDDILDYYNAMIAKREKDEEIQQVENEQGVRVTRSGNKKVELNRIELLNEAERPTRAFQIGERATLQITFTKHETVTDATIGLLIRDRLGNDVFGTNTFHLDTCLPDPPGEYCLNFDLGLELGTGNYSITIASHTLDSHVSDNHDWWDQALVFQMVPNNAHAFIGIANLPVTARLSASS